MDSEIIKKKLDEVKNLITTAHDDQEKITDVFLRNFERFAERITRIEMELFGKSED